MSDATLMVLGFLTCFTLVILAGLGRKIRLKISSNGIDLCWEQDLKK